MVGPPGVCLEPPMPPIIPPMPPITPPIVPPIPLRISQIGLTAPIIPPIIALNKPPPQNSIFKQLLLRKSIILSEAARGVSVSLIFLPPPPPPPPPPKPPKPIILTNVLAEAVSVAAGPVVGLVSSFILAISGVFFLSEDCAPNPYFRSSSRMFISRASF